MKPRNHFTHVMIVMAMVVVLLPLAVAQGAKIRMPDFSNLADKAKESVDISLEGEQLKTAGAFLGGNQGANDPQVAELLAGLEGIFIKVFEFEKPGQYSMRDIEGVIKQVQLEGWSKLMSVRDGDERVEMWLRDNDVNGGMFFVASEPTELVMINIVGKVNLAALSKLQGKMGIPSLPGLAPAAPPGPPAPPARPAPAPGR